MTLFMKGVTLVPVFANRKKFKEDFCILPKKKGKNQK